MFLPRIRFERAFKGGKIWVVEPLFPNYLFARFHLERHLGQVRYAAGVSSLVHFGSQIPVLPDQLVEELKTHFHSQAIIEINPGFAPGDEVRIIAGAFGGLEALITRVMPGRQRVGVLLDFLGRQVMVEVATAALLPARPAREILPPTTAG